MSQKVLSSALLEARDAQRIDVVLHHDRSLRHSRRPLSAYVLRSVLSFDLVLLRLRPFCSRGLYPPRHTATKALAPSGPAPDLPMPVVRFAAPRGVVATKPRSAPSIRALVSDQIEVSSPLTPELGASSAASVSLRRVLYCPLGGLQGCGRSLTLAVLFPSQPTRTTEFFTILPPTTVPDATTLTATAQPPTQLEDPQTSIGFRPTSRPPAAVNREPVAFTNSDPVVLAGAEPTFTSNDPLSVTSQAPTAVVAIETPFVPTPVETSTLTAQPPTTIVEISNPNPSPTIQPPSTATSGSSPELSTPVPLAFAAETPEDVHSSFTDPGPTAILLPTSTPLLAAVGETSQPGAFDIPGLSATAVASPTIYGAYTSSPIGDIDVYGTSGTLQGSLDSSASGVASLLYSMSDGVLVTLTQSM